MAAVGRRSKYTPETVKKICDGIRMGATYEHAAAYAGVTYETFNEWRKAKSDFSEAVLLAEGEGALALLGRIQQSAKSGSWRAASWILERRHPESYGRQIIDHGNADNEPFQIEAKVMDYRTGLGPMTPPEDDDA
jgi:transposase